MGLAKDLVKKKLLEREISKLSEEDKMLIDLRDELYDGNWGKMVADLKDRLKTRPYVHKLVNRIGEDLERIDSLQLRGFNAD